MADDASEFVLQIKCPDRTGVVARVASALADEGCDIREAAVYGDPATGIFFVRMHVLSLTLGHDAVSALLDPIARELALQVRLFDLSAPMRTLIAVSKTDHCLNDLLHKHRIGALPIEVVGVVSNHLDLKDQVEAFGLTFHHLPVTPETRVAQEARLLALVENARAELVVLARYMQILSNELAAALSGRCINIHHSFLPSFKGARPYHQAHARGVKLIGATAHYVTADLDEGPIIEQDVRRVSHAATPEDLVAIGREVEASVLARAVRWHAQHRVFLNGQKTVVFA